MNERAPEHGKRTSATRPGRLAVLWAALLWLGLAGPAAAQGGVIRVGGDLNYPPYEFINEQGEPDGYNTELTLAIAEVMGMQVEIELGHWQQMRRRLLDGELDVLQGAVFSPEPFPRPMRRSTTPWSPARARRPMSAWPIWPDGR